MHTEHKVSKEQRILFAMRKLLASIVRDTTPSPGMKHILSESTREDIRMCFGLISARERELAEEAGLEVSMRPRYADEPTTSSVVSIDSLKRTADTPKKDSEEGE